MTGRMELPLTEREKAVGRALLMEKIRSSEVERLTMQCLLDT